MQGSVVHLGFWVLGSRSTVPLREQPPMLHCSQAMERIQRDKFQRCEEFRTWACQGWGAPPPSSVFDCCRWPCVGYIYIHTYIHIHFLFDFIHILFKYVYTYVLTQYGHAESGNEPRAGPIQSLARLCILEQYITVGYKVV